MHEAITYRSLERVRFVGLTNMLDRVRVVFLLREFGDDDVADYLDDPDLTRSERTSRYADILERWPDDL